MQNLDPEIKLFVSEMFCSIQGETTRAGYPSFFVRLAGCNLRCSYCDTAWARGGGVPTTVRNILAAARKHRGVDHITVTGGEPMVQGGAVALMRALLSSGFAVQLETNGSLDLSRVPAAVMRIVDVKTPSSGEEGSFLLKNIDLLRKHDELKCVIADEGDYLFSKRFVKKYLEKKGVAVNFSPVHGAMPAAELAERILKDRLPVRLNLQLHKIIWPAGEPGAHS